MGEGSRDLKCVDGIWGLSYPRKPQALGGQRGLGSSGRGSGGGVGGDGWEVSVAQRLHGCVERGVDEK